MDEFQNIWLKVLDKATRSRLDRLEDLVGRLAEGGGYHYGSIICSTMIEYLSKKELNTEKKMRCVYGMSSVLRGRSTTFDRRSSRFMRGLMSELERHVDTIADAFKSIAHQGQGDKVNRILRLWRAERVLGVGVLDTLGASLHTTDKGFDHAVKTPDVDDTDQVQKSIFEERMARMQQSSARVEYMKSIDME
ncbi:hypothetical protein PSENEW3_00004579 [Picochlorum sp. SENEW3]|nr:hypothetical protein PSENEW3_00004579 [Picochlorum sp. SENEW3]